MKNRCLICNNKVSGITKQQIGDGIICPICGRICNHSTLVDSATVKILWETNHQRFKNFQESSLLTSFGSGFIHLDLNHQWCYIVSQKKPKLEPVVFAFNEIEGYTLEVVGQKTITKTKGGIGRAIVGGALFGSIGAVVGASTAKQETKTTGGINILKIDLVLNGVKTTVSISNPPLKAQETIDSMMNYS